MLLDVRIEPTSVRIPGGRTSDRATVPGRIPWELDVQKIPTLKNLTADLGTRVELILDALAELLEEY